MPELTTPEIKAELIDLDYEVLKAAVLRLPRDQLYRLSGHIDLVLGIHTALVLSADNLFERVQQDHEDQWGSDPDAPPLDVTWDDCNSACLAVVEHYESDDYIHLQDSAIDHAYELAEERRKREAATPEGK